LNVVYLAADAFGSSVNNFCLLVANHHAYILPSTTFVWLPFASSDEAWCSQRIGSNIMMLQGGRALNGGLLCCAAPCSAGFLVARFAG